MNEIPNEIIEAAMRLPLPKFAKGGFIPLERASSRTEL